MAENMENIISLTDEEGNEVEFEFLDLVEYNGGEYVILTPLDEEEEGEVVILLIENGDTDEECYASVDDEEELKNVFEIFKERNKDYFTFND